MKKATLILISLVAVAMLFGVVAPSLAAQPKSGGTLVWGRGSDSKKLDPSDVTDGESLKVTQQIYDTLVRYKKTNTEVIPGLAESWTTSEDGLVWTFKLRKGVKFHDGTDFNAEAVVFNFQRWSDPNHPYHNGEFPYWGYMFGGYPGVVKEIKALDEYTVQFTLNQPQAPFLQNLAMPVFAIASPTAVKKYGPDYFKNPVGTGPFKFVSWQQDSQIIVERNEDYWDGKAYLDRIIFKVIPDNSARFLELQTGSIDIMDGLNPSDVEFVKQDSSLTLHLRPSFNIGYLAMNMDKKPFDNVLVRRAINHAINKEMIVEAFYSGLGQPAKNPMPPTLWGYNDEIEDYEYNPEKARQLLKEAGYPNGFETELWAMPNPRPYFPEPRKIAEAMQADLADVGINAKIVTYDWATYLDKTEDGEHTMAMLGWTGDNGDPDNFLYVLLDKDNAVKGTAGNIAFYRSDELHDLLIEAQQTPNKERRIELYKKAQEIIHRDAPWVCVVHSTPPIPAKSYVKGYTPHPTGTEQFTDVWLDK